ncbi:MAG TPA: methyltransferase domain-containing protein [Kribbella sp.]|nr:methyltransferase domain-containing protein [Kribbella sp.]
MATFRDRVLGSAAGYTGWKRLIRADRVMRTFVDEYLKPQPGMRVLDVGCGTGDVVEYLEGVDYVGVDINPRYIEAAGRAHAGKGRFLTTSVDELPTDRLGRFDAVIAIGLLHHVSDDIVRDMMAALSGLLEPDSRFVALDGVWHPDQHVVARVATALDRGTYVRDAAGYERLIREYFDEVGSTVRHDLLPFPYSHCFSWGTSPHLAEGNH